MQTKYQQLAEKEGFNGEMLDLETKKASAHVTGKKI